MEIAIQIIINMLVLGLLYGVITVTFSLVYSVTKVLHVAHGSVVLASAYALFVMRAVNWPLWLAVILAVVVGVLLGSLMNQLVYEKLRRHRKVSVAASLIVTLAFMMIVQNILLMLFGPGIATVFDWQPTSWAFGLVTFSAIDLIVVVVSACLLVVVAIFMRYAKLGRAFRAVADNEEVAEVVGINAKRARQQIFILASAVAGIMGILWALKFSVEPNMAVMIGLKSFARAIVGGIGSPLGALVGSLSLEAVEQTGSWYLAAAYREVFAFLLVFIFLLVRPHGLFGKRGR